jgi:hypothetical protein
MADALSSRAAFTVSGKDIGRLAMLILAVPVVAP